MPFFGGIYYLLDPYIGLYFDRSSPFFGPFSVGHFLTEFFTLFDRTRHTHRRMLLFEHLLQSCAFLVYMH